MLSCHNLTVRVGSNQHEILSSAQAHFYEGGLNAVIGPSGCGKTTLMKAILGILPSTGDAYCRQEKIKHSEDLVGQVGFVPQFSIAHDDLSVAECLSYALELFVQDRSIASDRLTTILETIGLSEHQNKSIGSLSGGQLRRLGLGLELTTDPDCLVCDEVTSGLDPNSEDQILALLRQLSTSKQKTFICIIHNLAKLNLFDLITVVYQGDVIFQGNLEELLAYFQIEDALHLYDLLAQKERSQWQEKWQEHKNHHPIPSNPQPAPAKAVAPPPHALRQLGCLLKRRYTLLFRDWGYLVLTLAITFGFPCVVVIFALDGLPQIEGLSLQGSDGLINNIQQTLRFKMEAAQTASLVTGLIMFQVILLTLMGSNNGAREIAAERTILEKEKLCGLNPWAYGFSKIVFVASIALFQGLWMTFFVKVICEFPGSWLAQCLVLSLCCFSMSIICLGFSALAKSTEKASLLSIYLVGFQLPLSGVVLALPSFLEWIFRPFINAYWSWSGYLHAMLDSRLYDAFRENNNEHVASIDEALLVLSLHLIAGSIMVFWGCQKKQWK